MRRGESNVSDYTASQPLDSSGTRRLSPVRFNRVDLQSDIDELRRKKSIPSMRLPGEEQKEPAAQRVLIVSSKLPFTVFWSEDKLAGTAKFEIERDPFELNVAALLSSVDSADVPVDRVLLGTPSVRRRHDGSVVDSATVESIRHDLDDFLRQESCVPVYSPFRYRFADWMIWPLFHYSLPSCETGLGDSDYEGYQLVNEIFRDAVLKEYRRGDLVWINDYPLMLLPKLLRLKKSDITIGFYLHCVFPSSEVYRILPQREEILRGVLSSNIVGFHNFEYMQQFLNSCIHILGLECSASCIEACEDAGGTTTKVVTVPLGINIEPYQKLLNAEPTRARMRELDELFAGKKLLLAVDLLEEKKGIPHKIMAFHRMLQRNPNLVSECIFLQIVEHSASYVHDYAEAEIKTQKAESQGLLSQVYQMVGEVNSKFGKIGHLPVHFLVQDFSKAELVALLAKADVLIDTPLRDVLSRTAHEFLLCQEHDGRGTLILSEFSGSAQSLRAAAITVNPWSTSEFADAILQALTREEFDFSELLRYGHKHVQEYTLKNWATNFLQEMHAAERELESERLQIPPQLDHDQPCRAYRKASRRLLVFGFSGTLVPHKSRLFSTVHPKLPPALRANLQALAEDSLTQLIIVSGLSRETLETSFEGVHCWIIAEGGVCYREPGATTWHSCVEQDQHCDEQERQKPNWLGPVKEIMEYFAARTPGSDVIEMSSSVSWLYQKTQGDHAAIQSKDLLVHLWAGPLLSAPAEVVVDKDSVTVRPSGVGKALQLERLLHQICAKDGLGEPSMWLRGDSMVLCVGDFLMRDEDIYAKIKDFFEVGLSPGPLQNEEDELNLRGNPSTIPEQDGREERLLAVNSLSLGSGYHFNSTSKLMEDDSPMRSTGSDGEADRSRRRVGSKRRTPSEPGADDRGGERLNSHETSGFAEDRVPGPPSLYTCTVHRKATRAQYYVSDTNDVAFLLAQLAREVRKATAEAESASASSPICDSPLRGPMPAPANVRRLRDTPGSPLRPPGSYPGLTSLFPQVKSLTR